MGPWWKLQERRLCDPQGLTPATVRAGQQVPRCGASRAQHPCASWTSADQPPGLALCGHRCWTHRPGQGPVTTWVRVSWASGPGSPLRLPLGVRPDQACLSPDLGPLLAAGSCWPPEPTALLSPPDCALDRRKRPRTAPVPPGPTSSGSALQPKQPGPGPRPCPEPAGPSSGLRGMASRVH